MSKRNVLKLCSGFILPLVCVLALSTTGLAVDPATIDPNTYPEMDDREIGHLRYYFNIADQDLDDFTNMETPNLNMIPLTGALQFRESSYRYQIAFMTYFLAMEQYHKWPAMTDIIKPKFDRMIQKMMQRAVWAYWGQWVSRGLIISEPVIGIIHPTRHDPIKDDNIMYSGHLGHMIGLYEKLYQDFKYSEPGAIVLEWRPDEVFVYDTHSLIEAMLSQHWNKNDYDNGIGCIECEPNFCFAMCNTHPVLAYKLYDQNHGLDMYFSPEYGTNVYDNTVDIFNEWFFGKGIISDTSHEIATFYLVAQDYPVIDDHIGFGNWLDIFAKPLVRSGVLYVNLAANVGWTGYFMHAFNEETRGFIDDTYPYWIENHLIDINDDYADVTVDRFEDQLGLGFFAMIMAEVGETDLVKRLVNRAEFRYRPRWKLDGTYHYPFFNEAFISGGPLSRFTASGLTGKLFANALACPPNGNFKMHNDPFVGAEPTALKVINVDFPNIIICRAIYDDEIDALIITTEDPWEKWNTRWQKSTFSVVQMDPSKTYVLTIDGVKQGTYTGSTTLNITVKVKGRHDVILAAQ